MFRSIAFYIGEKTLDLNGHAFPLGELTAEVLNITPDEYHKLRRILVKAVRKMADYEKSRQIQDWFEANEHMMPSRKAISLCKKIINGQTSSDMAVEEIKRDYGAESGYRHDGWFWTLRCICCG